MWYLILTQILDTNPQMDDIPQIIFIKYKKLFTGQICVIRSEMIKIDKSINFAIYFTP